MNKNELLKKIQSFSENKQQAEIEKKKKLEERRFCIERQIRNLIPRMKDMYEIMYALYDAKLDNTIFTTDCINHRIGFFTDTMNIKTWASDKIVCHPLREFGIAGGGCNGADFVIELDTEAIYRRNSSDLYIGHMKKVLEDFDNFEEKLNQFVENLK